MARVEVEAKAKTVIKRIKQLQEAVEDSDPILQEIGETLKKTTVQRFYSQTSPTGKRWKPSKAAKKKKRLTLVKTGALRESFEVKLGRDGVYIGTNVWYSRVHQQGGPINAHYKNRTNLKRLARDIAAPTAQGAKRIAKQALKKRRRVRLPARRFLGISKRDRKRTTKILMQRLQEAMS